MHLTRTWSAVRPKEQLTYSGIQNVQERYGIEGRRVMKVYIAGPITNDPDYRIKFDRAEWILRDKGYDVANPAKNKPPEGKEWTYRDYINAGLRQLMTCDAIYMLKGWTQSNGAYLERMYAWLTGMQILSQEKIFAAGKS